MDEILQLARDIAADILLHAPRPNALEMKSGRPMQRVRVMVRDEARVPAVREAVLEALKKNGEFNENVTKKVGEVEVIHAPRIDTDVLWRVTRDPVGG